MKIKRIGLENIRSYKNGLIEVPEGKVLFTGDIGSGKTTALLALEFALFGLRRGGPILLRHGEDYGSVELNFSIKENDVRIRRSLRRGKSGITSDECFIGLDGGEIEKTSPTELKQKVLEILGYPQELLSKTNPLMYRYTVYTPQEEMKQIVLSETEKRLETIRKVFNVDKYKLIKDNSKILASFLKTRRKELDGRVYDLDEKKQESSHMRKEQESLETQRKEIEPRVISLRKKLEDVKQERELIEEEVGRLKEAKNKLELFDAEQKRLVETISREKEEMNDLTEEITMLQEELKDKKAKDFSKEIESHEKELDKLDYKTEEKKREQYSLSRDVEIAKENISKINELEDCPVCKQRVAPDHKRHIEEEMRKLISPKEEKIASVVMDIEKLELKRKELEHEKKELEKLQQERNVIILKKEHLEKAINRQDRLEKETVQNKKRIGVISGEKLDLFKKLKSFEEVNSKFLASKKLEEEVRSEERKEEIRLVQLKENLRSNTEIQNRLQKEIMTKERDRIRSAKIGEFLHFIEGEFFSLIDDIERNVMIRIHRDFNEAFIKWFDILVGQESIHVRTDFSFNPRIEQDGYETDYDSLSGGERTACALAYRLALNQAINKMAETIQTKNLIILDEPTDGFSSEQLERLKMVLDELDNEQIIIVSHEAQIEQYVDRVLRFEKVGGETIVS